MNPSTDRTRDDDREPPASPYGPQPRGVDEAAGGADSSPYETEPTGERREKAEEERRAGRNRPDTGDANEAP